MGAVLPKKSHEKDATNTPKNGASPSTVVPTNTKDPAPPARATAAKTDAELDLEEELEDQRQEQFQARQRAAVQHVVDNIFTYAPVRVQAQKFPASSPKAGKKYLWITVDEAELKHIKGYKQSPIRYPIGVAVDEEGNVFVSEAGSKQGFEDGKAGNDAGDGQGTMGPTRISGQAILDLAKRGEPPPVPLPPTLVESAQHKLVIKWKVSQDGTVDRYEAQYRLAESVHTPWMSLITVLNVKHVALEDINCHTPYEFRVRAHNPIGWSEYSPPSELFWTKPGIPSTPVPPIGGAVADSFISVFWCRVQDNGATPVVYTLEKKEHGTTQFEQIYQGQDYGFVVSALKASTSYVFRIKASNPIGATSWVESKPLRTLVQPKPETLELTQVEKKETYDRWVVCWDPKSEQTFYFNRFTCERQVHEPPEVTEAREKKGVGQVEQTPEMIFRRKRFRFHRDLRQNLGGFNLGNVVNLELARDTMFEDTFDRFAKFSRAELVSKPKIVFKDEAGIDSGGLTKDWYLQVSKMALRKELLLFRKCDRGEYEMEPDSFGNPKDLAQFGFLGKFVAKAIFDRQTLDLPLCDVVFKHLLGIPIDMDDLKRVDAQYHKSLVWMLENCVTDVIDESFCIEKQEPGGKKTIIDLKENGRDIPVTELNKKEYVELLVKWRTEFAFRSQLDAFLNGMEALIPLRSLRMFDLHELKMLVNGKTVIDVEELRANTVFQGGYSENCQVVLWLWQALREFTQELRGAFLKFMTGTNKIPLDGFEPPLNLTKSDLDPQALPRTHTCFNQLVLPEYTSYKTLVDKVTFAITNADGFELS